MTDMEDEPNLEQRAMEMSRRAEACVVFGRKMLHDAYNSADPHGLVLDEVRDVASEFVDYRRAKNDITNFMIDRYRFYARHMEYDRDRAVYEMHADTLEFLLRLRNGFPLTEGPFITDWRIE